MLYYAQLNIHLYEKWPLPITLHKTKHFQNYRCTFIFPDISPIIRLLNSAVSPAYIMEQQRRWEDDD